MIHLKCLCSLMGLLGLCDFCLEGMECDLGLLLLLAWWALLTRGWLGSWESKWVIRREAREGVVVDEVVVVGSSTSVLAVACPAAIMCLHPGRENQDLEPLIKEEQRTKKGEGGVTDGGFVTCLGVQRFRFTGSLGHG